MAEAVRRLRVGLISDTHGLLRPEALAALRGSDHIVHAGDIGAPGIVEALRDLAPVTAIRGNVDRGDWAAAYPETATVELGGVLLHVLHDLASLGEGSPPGVGVVVYGHSHRPGIKARGSVLFVNPGSAGRRRFRLPLTVATLAIKGGRAGATIQSLPVLG